MPELIGGLSIGAVYAIIAIGIVVIVRATGVVNFAQGEVLTVGAFAYVLASAHTGSPLLLALASVAAGMAFGLVLYLITAHLLKRANPIGVVIGTLGVSIIVQALLRREYTDNPRAASGWIFGDDRIAFLGTQVTVNSLVVIAVAVIAGLALHVWFKTTLTGKTMEVIAREPDRAALSGIKVGSGLLAAWLLGGALAGMAGMLVAPITGVYPMMGAEFLFGAFVAALIGGFSSIIGALIGGLALGVIQTYAVVTIGGTFREVMVFAIVLLILLLRPTGLIGEHVLRRY